MQQLISAYQANDLHTLLRLELEWIEGEADNSQRLSEEKLAVYNAVLREQVRHLEDQYEGLPLDPRYQAVVRSDGPFSVHLLDGPRTLRGRKQQLRAIETALARLRSDDALVEVRECIREHRDAKRRQRSYDDFLFSGLR